MIPPEKLRRGWVALDKRVYDIGAIADRSDDDNSAVATELLEKWGGKVCPGGGGDGTSSGSAFASAEAWAVAGLTQSVLDTVAVGSLAPELTMEQIKAEGWIAFQGGVFDLDEFAVGHPGGSELITEWKGKEGTDALLDAHPGGQAMIRNALSEKEFAEAYKGSIPYVRKKRVLSKLKSKRRRRRKKALLSLSQLRVLLSVVVPALLAMFAGYFFDFRPTDWVPNEWPTRADALNMLFGAVVATCIGQLFRGKRTTTTTPVTTSSTALAAEAEGSGAGGWTYGKVTPQFIERIRQACPDDDQVRVCSLARSLGRSVGWRG